MGARGLARLPFFQEHLAHVLLNLLGEVGLLSCSPPAGRHMGRKPGQVEGRRLGVGGGLPSTMGAGRGWGGTGGGVPALSWRGPEISVGEDP